MPLRESKQYYWLKLNKDFFKRHDIRIVEGMDNGKDYILFYMKLLLESIDHEGRLRFSETIPYNEKMLSTITNTNVDIVRAAIQVFRELKLMEILDDKTIYMTQTNLMLGTETEWASKKREYREKQKQLVIETDTLRTKKDNVRQEIEKEIEIDIEKELKDIKNSVDKTTPTKRFTPPSIEEISLYCEERQNNVNAEKFHSFYEMKGWMVGKNKMKDWKAAIRTWEQDKDSKQVNGKYGVLDAWANN
jgi:predicted phage replisome organizer